MPRNPVTSQEQRRMITFDAIDRDGTRKRLRFETEPEAQTAADQHREAGHSITWIASSESLQRWVSIPEERAAMANLMPLVHQARRTIRNRQERNPFVTNDVIEARIAACLAAPNERVSHALKLELHRLEMLI